MSYLTRVLLEQRLRTASSEIDGALGLLLRDALQEIEAPTVTADPDTLRGMVLDGCAELGRHGLQATEAAGMALARLIVNADRLAAAVDLARAREERAAVELERNLLAETARRLTEVRDELRARVAELEARAVEANSGRILLAVANAYLEHRPGGPLAWTLLARLRTEAERHQAVVDAARAAETGGGE